jgi:hypothetical protein
MEVLKMVSQNNFNLGSSKGVREFLESSQLKEFIEKNPQIEFKFLKKRGYHPFISSTYINGFIKDVPLRNIDPEDIINEFYRVRNSCNILFLLINLKLEEWLIGMLE